MHGLSSKGFVNRLIAKSHHLAIAVPSRLNGCILGPYLNNCLGAVVSFILVPADANFERQIHSRLLDNDPTAPGDLCREHLKPIERHLAARAYAHGVRDQSLVYDATVDAVFDYIQHPAKFDANQSTLLGYLKRAGERDLINQVRRDRRLRRGEELHDDVELSIVAGNKQADVEKIRRNAEAEAVGRIDTERKLSAAMSNMGGTLDQVLFRLLASGERNTAKFAAVLGISNLPITEQRRVVKQHKDRLKKTLQRREEKYGG